MAYMYVEKTKLFRLAATRVANVISVKSKVIKIRWFAHLPILDITNYRAPPYRQRVGPSYHYIFW